MYKENEVVSRQSERKEERYLWNLYRHHPTLTVCCKSWSHAVPLESSLSFSLVSHSLLLPLKTFCSSFPFPQLPRNTSCSLLLLLNPSVPLHRSFYILLSLLFPYVPFNPLAQALLLWPSYSCPLLLTFYHPLSPHIFPISSALILFLPPPPSISCTLSLSLSSTLFLPCYPTHYLSCCTFAPTCDTVAPAQQPYYSNPVKILVKPCNTFAPVL